MTERGQGIAPEMTLSKELAAIILCIEEMLADPELDALAFDKHDSRIILAALSPSPLSEGAE